jgi:hypothetical protein
VPTNNICAGLKRSDSSYRSQ